MRLSRFWLLYMLVVLPFAAFAQAVEEKLIVKDAGDSVFFKAFRCSFDTDGNYYFETLLKGNSGKFSLATNKKKYSPVFIGSSIATTPYKALVADAFFSDSSKTRIYYKNKNGTRLYGPHAGRIREVLESGRNDIAIELCVGAKSHLYINDSLVNSIDSQKQQWLCNFSDNGHVIYSFYSNRGNYKLYLDHKLIDSSAEPFSEISVNDGGNYLYAKAQNGKYHIHTARKVYGPFGAVEHADLWNSGAFYASGCADSQCYVLVNDHLFNNIPEAHTYVEEPNGNIVYKSDEQIVVEPVDAEHYLFSYNRSGEPGINFNINGKVVHFNYTYTSFVLPDKNGGYAFYGTKTDTATGADRIYRNFSGRENKIPLFRRKGPRRVQHLLAAPGGESMYYIEMPDSVFLFRNDTLFCPPARRSRFLTWDASVLPQSHPDGIEYFQGINIEGASYFIYNNTISKPLPLIYPEYDRLAEPKKGLIAAGDINSNGFFIIVNNGPGTYELVINNKEYRTLTGIDRIFGETTYLTDKALIFYGTKGNGFYQFRLPYTR